jgi:alpha-L-fucosidase
VLLNVGPRPDGLIDPEQVARLKEIGAWLGKNGASIYGTRGGPWKPTQAIASTRKSKTIYVHVLSWPDETLKLPGIRAKVIGSRLLNGQGAPSVRQTDNAIEISLPVAQRDTYDTVIALELDSDAMAIPALDIQPQQSKQPAR